MTRLPASERLANVDALRGLAALSVAWFHFTHGNPNFLPEGLMKSSGTWGWLGVEVFFVISGFVLPFSLQRAGYQLVDFWRFLAKRLMRLEPPYLVSIGLVLVLGWLSAKAPGFAGKPQQIDGYQLLSHFGYLAAVLDYNWLNPVFWTLAMEFQFYLLVGVSYGLVMSQNTTVRWFAIIFWLVLSAVVETKTLVFEYLGLFALGLLTVWLRNNWVRTNRYIMASICIATVVSLKLGFAHALAGLLSAWMIAWLRVGAIRELSWLGAISYSLYLVHVPIGGRVINLGARFAEQTWEQVFVLVCALAVSLISAHFLFRLIEYPAMKWASSVSYRYP